jgi:hypothetical protein
MNQQLHVQCTFLDQFAPAIKRVVTERINLEAQCYFLFPFSCEQLGHNHSFFGFLVKFTQP